MRDDPEARLLLGRFGNVEVGYIAPTMLTGDKEDRLILLSGKSWRITVVDWKKRVVWLAPVKEGGKARWTGSGRTLSREIAPLRSRFNRWWKCGASMPLVLT